MSGKLDLAAPPSGGQALGDLRARAAAYLGADPGRLVLAATPDAFALVGEAPDRADIIGPPDCPVAALTPVGDTETVRRIESTLSARIIRAGLDALAPAALAGRAAEAGLCRDILAACASGFSTWPEIASARLSASGLDLVAADPDALVLRLTAAGIAAERREGGVLRLYCADVALANALRERLGIAKPRSASQRRTTAETDIAVWLDLDRDGSAEISTGIEFFDHMLEQIARHGGFALRVTASGDLGVDAHHTVEDVCLALGAALADALGDKRGIARFGFELPMDEARAGVWIDLSGRPYAVFYGDIPGERVGGLPVEMVPHAFRSLAEALKASIQVEVRGENAHHMTEACFKAFGRALRQAIRVEGNVLPSTKGAL